MMENLKKPQPDAKKKCVVYVDGFNFYWGIVKHFPRLKWLNLQTFFEALRLDDEVAAIKYFTAIVEKDRAISNKRDKQNKYLSALKTLSKISIVLGRFQLRDATCKGDCKMKYYTAEEKKTDVNIAVSMIDDSIKKCVEHIVLVSGDSDLEPAVEWVRKNHPSIKVTVYIPCVPDERHKRRNDFYQTIGVQCKFLPLSEFDKHQFPESIKCAGGGCIEKPKEWC